MLVIFILLCAAHAASAVQKERIVIFELSIVYKKSFIMGLDNEPEKKDEARDYYAMIIPRTLAKELSGTDDCEVVPVDQPMPLEGFGSDAFYDNMTALVAPYGARYCVGGRVTMQGIKITVELAVIDLKTRDFFAVTRDTYETGAELMKIISDLSKDVRAKLARYRDAVRPIPPQEKPSPFLNFYRSLSRLSFGVQGGHLFIKGAFARVYGDGNFISPHLSLDLTPYVGITLQTDFLSAENLSKNILHRSALTLWGSTINADVIVRMAPRFGITLSPGFGVSYGSIYLYNSFNPFQALVYRRHSMDPYLNTAAFLWLRFDPVTMRFGSSFKAVFFKGKPLYLIAAFFGIGYHL